MTQVGRVAALFRYPAKSMLGEVLDAVEFTERGLAGDRAFAVVGKEDDRVASAKDPRKWARLLEVRATYVDDAGSPVVLTFPDGSAVRSDDDDVDERLSSYLGREVTLRSQAHDGRGLEGVRPRIDGLPPSEAIEATTNGRSQGDDPVSAIGASSLAPAGHFFDLATLHVITTATLSALEELDPSANFDVRRFRPNVLADVDDRGFVENKWTGSTLAFGASARARVDLPTMRCVMTTMAHGDVPADRRTLQTIARHNRVEISGLGISACAGVYATITHGGTVGVGDAVDQLPSL